MAASAYAMRIALVPNYRIVRQRPAPTDTITIPAIPQLLTEKPNAGRVFVHVPVMATGGTAPYTYAVTQRGGHALPTGVTWDAANSRLVVAATAAVGQLNLTLTATDSATTPARATRDFVLRINASAANLAVSGLANRDVVAGSSVQLTPSILGGTAPYRAQLLYADGNAVPSGDTPPGANLAFNESSNRVYVASQFYNAQYQLIYRVIDSGQAQADQHFVLTVRGS